MEKRAYRLALFASLYFAQGAMMSYFLTFNILYLGEAGYSQGDVGVFQAVLAIPFVLKMFLGMLSDRVNLLGMGHRKPYILLGLLAQIGIVVWLPSVSIADGLDTFAIAAFIASMSMALYDTCTDGLALDSSPKEEYSQVQGLMVGARAAGILVLLLAGGFIQQSFGWAWVFYAVALAAVIPFVLAFGISEDPAQLQRQDFDWKAFGSFRNSTVMSLALIGLIYATALDGVLTFLSDYLNDVVGATIGSVGALVALSMVGRIIGALSNGPLVARLGQRKAMYLAIGLASAACFGLSVFSGVTMIAILGLIFGIAYGYFQSVHASLAMDLCDPRIAASMFAIFMMFLNVGTAVGQGVSGALTESLSFPVMVAIMGALNLVNLFLAPKVTPAAAAT